MKEKTIWIGCGVMLLAAVAMGVMADSGSVQSRAGGVVMCNNMSGVSGVAEKIKDEVKPFQYDRAISDYFVSVFGLEKARMIYGKTLNVGG